MKSQREMSLLMLKQSIQFSLLTSCALAVTAVLFLNGCGPSRATTEAGSAASANGAALRVVVQKPVAADASRELILPGTIEAWESATLFGRVTGHLDSVAVDIGDRVEAGSELARLIVPEMAAEFASARAHVVAARAVQELALITEKRTRQLHQRNPDAISIQQVDEAAAEARVAVAEANVAEAELKRLKALMRFAVLTAPFGGRITKRYLHPGALVIEGGSSGAQPVLEIARTDRLRAVFDVPEQAIADVPRGEEVQIMFDAYPGEILTATVSRVAGALDPRTRSMRAEVDLDNANDRYQPGMYAKVLVTIDPKAGALTLPSSAVRGSRDDRFVLVAENGLLRRQQVVVIADDGRESVVADGVTTDSLVMVAGSPLAAVGSAVEVVEEGGR